MKIVIEKKEGVGEREGAEEKCVAEYSFFFPS